MRAAAAAAARARSFELPLERLAHAVPRQGRYPRPVIVEVTAQGPEQPPAGARVVVQVLDTTYADAPAAVLAEDVGTITVTDSLVIHRATVDAVDAGGGATVRVHVDVDGDGEVSLGDFVTTQAYPVADAGAISVSVQRV